MSILIKGMEMPQWCSQCACNSMHYCQVLGRDVAEFLMTNRLPDDCPLVPIPPHGRLIDADAFKVRMMQGAEDAKEDALTDEIWARIVDAAKALCLDVDESPTIIEAEEAHNGE